MQTIKEYNGLGIYDNRKAVIQENGDRYFVDLYLEDILHRTVDLSGKSHFYAEDTAENWTTGIITS
jgi:hypothetical protein